MCGIFWFSFFVFIQVFFKGKGYIYIYEQIEGTVDGIRKEQKELC